MSGKPKSRVITARVPADYLEIIDSICEVEGTTPSEVVRDSIRKYAEYRMLVQRIELVGHVSALANDWSFETWREKEEFVARFLMEFQNGKQIDDFLKMPPGVIASSIKDAREKFVPTGELPKVEGPHYRYMFENEGQATGKKRPARKKQQKKAGNPVVNG